MKMTKYKKNSENPDLKNMAKALESFISSLNLPPFPVFNVAFPGKSRNFNIDSGGEGVTQKIHFSATNSDQDCLNFEKTNQKGSLCILSLEIE